MPECGGAMLQWPDKEYVESLSRTIHTYIHTYLLLISCYVCTLGQGEVRSGKSVPCTHGSLICRED